MTSATFDPVVRHTVSGEIRQRLTDAIQAGELAPGTPIPAERVLCQEFGVARTSVREAIQGLVIAGYVERRGNRSVVSECLPDVHLAGDAGPHQAAQLLEVRRVVEPAIVEMATKRASDAQRAELLAIAHRELRPGDEPHEIDRAFSAALGRACGNAMLQEVLAKVLAKSFADDALRAVDGAGARIAIADAIAKGHARKAVAAAVAHLDHLATPGQHVVEFGDNATTRPDRPAIGRLP